MNNKIIKTKKHCPKTFKRAFGVREIAQGIWGELKVSDSFLYLYRRFGTPSYDTNDEYKIAYESSNPQPIGFRGNLLVKRPKFFYCTYSLGITETS